ncbi:MAG: regulator [Verrucomicrobia bacterium]|nr:regulator [Verrucomicrobiota bacterium]
MARILLIDDDEVLLRTMSRILTNAGHLVASARDGAEGVELFRAEMADIVMTDLVMPHGGLLGIQELRTEFPELTIVAMSGNHSRLNMALEQGANRLLPKPFTADQLSALVKDILEKQNHSAERQRG